MRLSLIQPKVLRHLLPLLFLAGATGHAEVAAAKTQSVFFPTPVVHALQANLARSPWAQEGARQCLAAAQPWREKSDDELWAAMFGATIQRSWMVWSNGFCPACRKNVPMYEWKFDALHTPWKAACPQCGEQFPKNDFGKFYRSGLDAQGVFAPARADRSLLFNTDHPAANDPLHRFGVDDGTGYFDGTNRWHFIGAYLVRSQWKQVVLAGIRHLSTAYLLTGEAVYARKAAILLDRVADLYPTFDYLTQGLTYESANPITGTGMVSVWHDACHESLELALAYDMIFPAIAQDPELVRFLSAKAREHGLANPKASGADIRRNIEAGILREVLRRPDKIASNFPATDVTLIVSQAILDWPHNRESLTTALQAMLTKATAVDGLSGEKGLSGYSVTVPRLVAGTLGLFDRLAPDLLATLVSRVPNLKQTYRFHADTWLAESYYPKIGDTGSFGRKEPSYAGLAFSQNPLDPAATGLPLVSSYTLCWKLYELTHDPVYVKLLFRANGDSVANLPYDLLVEDPSPIQQAVARVIREQGTSLDTPSVNKEQWCLAVLRSGAGDNRRGVWLDYDVGGNHGRPDGMNFGLYAKGLELLSGFGYPPVQFGGWSSPRALWYKMTAAHNTVVVDGKNQTLHFGEPETAPLSVQLNPLKGNVRARTTAWSAGEAVKLIRVSGPELVQTTPLAQYERSLLLVDLSAEDSYVLDIFRVAGGRDHAKFLHGYFGAAQTTGLELQLLTDYGQGTQMRHFRGGTPAPGWQCDLRADDRYHYLPAGADVHLRYTDLTRDAQAAVAESWLVYQDAGVAREAWVPSVMVRRQSSAAPLTSTFVALLEPYAGQSNLRAITRLPLQTANGAPAADTDVAVAVEQANGRTDLLVAAAAGTGRRVLVQPDWDLTTDADFCLVRRGKSGEIEHVWLANGRTLKCGRLEVTLSTVSPSFEAVVVDGKLVIRLGSARTQPPTAPGK